MLISGEMLLGKVNGTLSASHHLQLSDQSPIMAASYTEISVLPTITEMCSRVKFDPGRGRNPSLLQTARKPGRVRGTHCSNMKGNTCTVQTNPAVHPQDKARRMS